ncbi:MAG: hypothetical protein L3K07_01430 [Thermoplasmata archaeon]|nr:hypothetical protein [Thermoplasmata archaeon]
MSAAETVDLILGLAGILLPIGILSAALFLVVRLAGRGDLRRGLAFIVFLSERQRTLVLCFAVTVMLFLLSGVFDGLTLLSILPEVVSDVAISLSDVGATVALLLLLVVGLRPRSLSPREAAAIRERPLTLAALGIPLGDVDES